MSFITPCGAFISQKDLRIIPEKQLAKLKKTTTHSFYEDRIQRTIHTDLTIDGNDPTKMWRLPRMTPGLYTLPFKLPAVVRAMKTLDVQYLGDDSPNQQIVVDHIMDTYFNDDLIESSRAACTLDMKPGGGKTHVGMRLIARLGFPTLIIVPNFILSEQWLEELTDWTRGATIGVFNGKRKQFCDITVCTVASVRKWPNVHEKFRKTGFIIYDEVHEYCADATRNIFWCSQRACSLGLTGTPNEHAKKLDMVYHLHLGDIVHAHELPGYNLEEVKFHGIAHIVPYTGPAEYTRIIINEATGKVDFMSTLSMISEDPQRNDLIVNIILQQLANGIHVFVFSDLRDHLTRVASLLRERSANIPITFTNDVLMGGSKKQEIKNAYLDKNASVIFTTYRFSAVGVSIERMNALILISPRKSKMRQIIGRIMRRGGDNTKPRMIYDILDMKLSIKSQLRFRKEAYTELGLKVIKGTYVATSADS